ncbi:hypothetical protein EJ06DRAFT_533713, partial [Trichodelitschia bisporula]
VEQLSPRERAAIPTAKERPHPHRGETIVHPQFHNLSSTDQYWQNVEVIDGA